MDTDKLNSKRKKKSGGITSRLRDLLLSPSTGRVTSEHESTLVQLSEQTRVLPTPRRAWPSYNTARPCQKCEGENWPKGRLGRTQWDAVFSSRRKALTALVALMSENQIIMFELVGKRIF